MSCSHVAGIVGLLKSLHPDWSPAAIKSAIMTSARTRDDRRNPMPYSNNKKATPFAYGAGHVRPNRAMDPGLVYDLSTNDYLNFLCGRGYNQSMIRIFFGKPYACPKSFSVSDLNYPSISAAELSWSGATTVSRKVNNVGSPGTYRVRVRSPAGVTVSVNPSTLTFNKRGEEKKFEVTFKSKRNLQSRPASYAFRQLIWSDGYHYVGSSLVVNHN